MYGAEVQLTASPAITVINQNGYTAEDTLNPAMRKWNLQPAHGRCDPQCRAAGNFLCRGSARAGGNELKANYTVYGADIALAVAPKVIFLSDKGYTFADTKLNYTILPPEYNAVTADIDIIKNSSWERYVPGSKTQGTDSATIVAGSAFDVDAVYTAQAVLNRGSDNEIRGDFVPLLGYNADLDVDSDNNSPDSPDGLQTDPARDWSEEYVEDIEGRPGKVIRANTGDKDKDGVPDYADGMNIFGNDGINASASFTPLLLQIKMSGGGKAKFRLLYPESDPSAISRTGDETAGYTYTPDPGEAGKGNIRIWTRNGAESRSAASFGAGGTYIKSGEEYSLAAMGLTSTPVIRLYAEGITSSSLAGDVRVQLQIDPDGDGPMPYIDADAVRFTVHDSALVPDYDRNRTIDDKDRKRAQAGDPFYFWINDDDDNGDTGGDDIPRVNNYAMQPYLNNSDKVVNGTRDLIDFFPVWLDIKDLLKVFDPGIYAYKLQSEDESLNFILTDLDALHSGYYLTGDNDNLNIPIALGKANTFTVNKGGTFLNNHPGNPAFLDGIRNGGKRIVLLEGRKVSTKPLELKIYDSKGTPVTSVKLNLSLDGVEQMFRHKNLTQYIKRDAQVAAGSEDGEADRWDIQKCPDVECLGEDPQNIKNFVFLHGYNVNGQQARGWHSEMFKRMFWSGSNARFWGVTWYGWYSQTLGNTINFCANVANAFQTSPELTLFLASLQGEKLIAAHSLGNMVVSSAISDFNAPVDKYFMFNAAVALEVFDETVDENKNMVPSAWNGYDFKLRASEWYKLFKGQVPIDYREQLTWRNRFDGVKYIAAYNYHSVGDEVVSWIWETGELDKGKVPVISPYGGWEFNSEWDVYNPYLWKYVTRPAFDANSIDPSELRIKPFFDKSGLIAPLLDPGTTGSEEARKTRNELLSRAIPATSAAIGRSYSTAVKDNFNINMQVKSKTTKTIGEDMFVYWPRSNGRWLHSDIKDVAYPYLFGLFDDIICSGGLGACK